MEQLKNVYEQLLLWDKQDQTSHEELIENIEKILGQRFPMFRPHLRSCVWCRRVWDSLNYDYGAVIDMKRGKSKLKATFQMGYESRWDGCNYAVLDDTLLQLFLEYKVQICDKCIEECCSSGRLLFLGSSLAFGETCGGKIGVYEIESIEAQKNLNEIQRLSCELVSIHHEIEREEEYEEIFIRRKGRKRRKHINKTFLHSRRR